MGGTQVAEEEEGEDEDTLSKKGHNSMSHVQYTM